MIYYSNLNQKYLNCFEKDSFNTKENSLLIYLEILLFKKLFLFILRENLYLSHHLQ